MADRGLDPQVLMNTMTGVIESALSKMSGIVPTAPSEAVEKDIVEYENRIRVSGFEKFQAASYISALNYYLTEADMQRGGKAKGAIIVYVDIENSGKIYKSLGFPFPDDEDDASMMECNGKLCSLLADGFRKSLNDQGYLDFVMSSPDNYRSSIVDGVEFSLDQKKMFEFSFFYFKRKTIVVELTLAGISMKK